MSIDWEKGEINEEPHEVRSEQVSPLVASLAIGGVAYVGPDALNADAKHKLWLNPDRTTVSAAQAAQQLEDTELCRIIRTPEGFVVDVSVGGFELNAHSQQGIGISGDDMFNHADEGWYPVIGLIETESQRESADEILFTHYGIMLGESALQLEAEPPYDQDADDAVEPGDGEQPA